MRNWLLDILSRAEKGTDLPFVAIQLSTGRVAGATRYLNIMPKDRGLEIGGTWYGPEFQRTPVNTECKYLLLRHAFETLGCIRVQLKTDLRNERSQKAIERLGAVREGVLRNHMILPDGRYRHSVFYSILDTEWPDVKNRLEQMLER
jgi:RimJ/RimL family protein N-acetyltransferase